MIDGKGDPLWTLLGLLFKRHPWHGVAIGAEAPDVVTCYIEIVPTDTVKYELDKMTGHLKIDRPQKYSSVCPTLYGLLPQTYCGERVAEASRQRTGRADIVGDGDPHGHVRADRSVRSATATSAARDPDRRVAHDRPQPGRRQDHRRARRTIRPTATGPISTSARRR